MKRRAQLGRARHQTLQVVRNFFLLDRARDSVFNQLRGFRPSQKFKHHRAAQHY